MRRLFGALLWTLAALALAAGSAEAADKIRVVTTTTDLKSLSEAVGGYLVEVDALARPSQNPHDLEVRPSLMVKVRRADLLIVNGLDLDNWVDVVIQGANNPRVIPGAPGRVDASRGIPVLEVPTTRVDRSMGDVHPAGNPHYTLDPGNAHVVTANILEGLARVAPEHRAAFERNRQELLGRVDQAMARWMKIIEPFRGTKVVVYHNLWIYFLTRFGLTQVGTVEDRPGIPATPAHLARLIRVMKDDKVKILIAEPWSDQKLAARVAQEAGAQPVVLAATVGSVKGADTYMEAIDYNVKTITQNLR